jgi:hypothetical protein
MEARNLPKSIDYTDVLPQSVPAVARRRKFYPSNGTTFNATGSSEIRIEVSSMSALLDSHSSYLEFRVTNTDAAASVGFDLGGGNVFFTALRIEQGGRVLSELQEYNRFHSAILASAQDSIEGLATSSLTGGQRAFNSGINGLSMAPTAAGQEGQAYIGAEHNSNVLMEVAAAGIDSMLFTMPIMSGLFTQNKLIPLPLVNNNSPITIVLSMANSEDVGVWDAQPAGAGVLSIDRISYNANLIEVGRDVIDQIKSVRDMSGGQLVLSGTDYEHGQGNIPIASVGEQIIRMPTRKRSIQSMFFSIQSDTFADGGAALARWNVYNLSFGGCANMLDYQLKVGSVTYPPTAIRAFQAEPVAAQGENHRSECIMELSKALGTLSFSKPTGILNTITYGLSTAGIGNGDTGDGAALTIAPGSYSVRNVCPFAMDLQSFNHTAIQSGIDTQTLSLETNLILNIGPGAPGAAVPIVGSGLQAKNVHMYVSYNQFYFFNSDGSITFEN